MEDYFIGAIISFILGFIYTTYINKHSKDQKVLTLIVVTLFSWLGVAMTVMGTLVIIVNKFSDNEAPANHYNFEKEGK